MSRDLCKKLVGNYSREDSFRVSRRQALGCADKCNHLSLADYRQAPSSGGMILPTSSPAFHAQEEKFQECALVWEGVFAGDDPQARVNALQGVGSVHDLAHRTAQIKELFHVLPISSPDGHGPPDIVSMYPGIVQTHS